MHKNRALLLDRDGVINSDDGYIGSVDRVALMPGLFAFLRAVRARGYRLAIVTNQSGVARGLFTEQDYHDVTASLVAALRREGIELDMILACFDHPQAALEKYRSDSPRRKPRPGMILEAIEHLNLDPASSAIIGDSLRDMQAGLAARIGTCLWLTSATVAPPPGVTVVRDFAAALGKL